MKKGYKFRALGDCGESKDKWVYGHYYKKNNLDIILDKKGMPHSINPNTLGFYSGLNTKDAAEIYEGDIIESEGKKYRIAFFDAAFSGVEVNTSHHCEQYLWQLAATCSVIGNIHTRKELFDQN